jgi:hypothetical protein
VTSQRKIAANRINGRKSRGPRTAAGKAAASRNALRHGLAANPRNNPGLLAEIAQMAKAICADAADPLLFEAAVAVAESELMLRCISAQRIAVIERLRDGSARALARGDNSIAVGKVLLRELDLAMKETDRSLARVGVRNMEFDMLPQEIYDRLEKLPPQPGWMPTPARVRNEAQAVCAALPDLLRLARYQRRAWSRRRRAIRNFVNIKSGGDERSNDRKRAPRCA